MERLKRIGLWAMWVVCVLLFINKLTVWPMLFSLMADWTPEQGKQASIGSLVARQGIWTCILGYGAWSLLPWRKSEEKTPENEGKE